MEEQQHGVLAIFTAYDQRLLNAPNNRLFNSGDTVREGMPLVIHNGRCGAGAHIEQYDACNNNKEQ
ncbi:hypothetical protein [Paraflavitalea speifideaquila]|uniref:hypothetical protein n=1 Tax=Paraflavitalea speifideaquila TaxID=3076558 RepID=UPI0028E6A964|nr:hypothetical protein [Paraflavitalea speifideiaquila]